MENSTIIQSYQQRTLLKNSVYYWLAETCHIYNKKHLWTVYFAAVSILHSLSMIVPRHIYNYYVSFAQSTHNVHTIQKPN
jgi:hypothetical protein